jgi:hypothetical protein
MNQPYDLWYDANTVDADLVVETWISQGPNTTIRHSIPNQPITSLTAMTKKHHFPHSSSNVSTTKSGSRSIHKALDQKHKGQSPS